MTILTIVLLLFGVLGLVFNVISVRSFRSGAHEGILNIDARVFKKIYFSCIIATTLQLGLMIIGGLSILLNFSGMKYYVVGSCSLPLLYIITLMIFGRMTKWKSEMASAMGIGNGGMSLAVFSLLPIWGPIVIIFRMD